MLFFFHRHVSIEIVLLYVTNYLNIKIKSKDIVIFVSKETKIVKTGKIVSVCCSGMKLGINMLPKSKQHLYKFFLFLYCIYLGILIYEVWK